MKGSGKAVPHDSAPAHVTGRALFIEDLPALSGELVVRFVGSPCARGQLRRIDVERAREVEGVVAILDHRDIPGNNLFGPVFEDEPFLVSERISYLGQPVVIVAAESASAAESARRLVAIETDEEPPVLTIEQARAAGELIGPERWIRHGDLEAGWQKASHRLEGTFECNGQEQFYLESQAALALPGEQGELWVHSSTQNPTEIQAVVAEVLGLGQHQVVCVCKRMGGAFGGKETQATLPAVAVALVAQLTGRAARIIYDKGEDMEVTGKRHAYRVDYRLGFDDDGRIEVAELDFLSNGGAFADLSTSVLERSMLHADSAYHLPNVAIRAQVCRTNLPPNTAFRGFGAPQGMAPIENAMQEIATLLGRDALAVRRANLYPDDPDSPRAITPYGQVVRHNLLPEIFERLTRSTDYARRLAEVEAFNRRSRRQLKGLALTPVKFGISFTTKFLNQANAAVNIYQDGSVQLSSGATEMGQGVNTKLAQLVAEELGIDIDSVTVMPTSTEKNNNTSPTAASASTDLNGTAAVRACAVLRGRLADLAAGLFADSEEGLAASPADIRFSGGEVWDERAPQQRMSFGELCHLARRERVDLGARGFYATPGIDFDRDTGRGTPFLYYTTGAAVAEVTLDRFTGELTVGRFDALMDIGRRINHDIDRGQAIGGIVQGIGWVTTEELCYGDRGELLSNSPTTYKIPNISDLPEIFNLDFLDNDLNRQNLRASKAVGEPPLMLGLAVWLGVKHALSFVAEGESAKLKLPATHEEILRCVTELEVRKAELERRLS